MTAALELEDVHVRFGRLRALDGVSLSVRRGRTLGIVGESGCGKSTLARVMVGLQAPTRGLVRVDGSTVPLHRSREHRKQIQMVFQDPSSTLNPRMTVGSMLRELLATHHLRDRPTRNHRVSELLDLVGLPSRVADVRPGLLSGGQKQRVSIARALAVDPDIIIADEAVAALDVSVQATIVNLFLELQDRLGLTLVFISHDLGVVRALCDDVVVMYLGRVVESSPAEALFENPVHPYTRALLRAAPRIEAHPHGHRSEALHGELPSPIDVPAGCRFHPRCPVALLDCSTHDPALRQLVSGRHIACVLESGE